MWRVEDGMIQRERPGKESEEHSRQGVMVRSGQGKALRQD